MKITNLINRTLNNTHYNNLISHFFEEVSDDIKLLNNDEMYSENPNPIVKENYNNINLIVTLRAMIQKKYKEKYCPTSLFDYFNESEKIHYIFLRTQIDKLLEIKDTFYKI